MDDITTLLQGIATLAVVTGIPIVFVRLLDGPDLRDLDVPRRPDATALDTSAGPIEPRSVGSVIDPHPADRRAVGGRRRTHPTPAQPARARRSSSADA